jgi:hypothetical protein
MVETTMLGRWKAKGVGLSRREDKKRGVCLSAESR